MDKPDPSPSGASAANAQGGQGTCSLCSAPRTGNSINDCSNPRCKDRLHDYRRDMLATGAAPRPAVCTFETSCNRCFWCARELADWNGFRADRLAEIAKKRSAPALTAGLAECSTVACICAYILKCPLHPAPKSKPDNARSATPAAPPTCGPMCKRCHFDKIAAELQHGSAAAPRQPEGGQASLREVARMFVEKIDRIHESDAYKGVWAVSQIHVGPYRGESYEAELNALRAALASAEGASAAPNRFDCSECGPAVKADEDGCCAQCGRDATVVRPLGAPDARLEAQGQLSEIGLLKYVIHSTGCQLRHQWCVGDEKLCNCGLAAFVSSLLEKQSPASGPSPDALRDEALELSGLDELLKDLADCRYLKQCNICPDRVRKMRAALTRAVLRRGGR